MTTDNKDCSGCKWFRTPYNACVSGRSAYLSEPKNRRLPESCGPSAKYYEPKEQQP